MNLDEIWEEIVKFNDKNFPNWRKREVIFLSNAIAGETGELCNKIKKLYGGGTNKETPTDMDISFEGFDIIVYLVMLLETLGIDREKFCEFSNKKLEILRRRVNGEE